MFAGSLCTWQGKLELMVGMLFYDSSGSQFEGRELLHKGL